MEDGRETRKDSGSGYRCLCNYCVRVPVFIGHGEAVSVEMVNELTVAQRGD